MDQLALPAVLLLAAALAAWVVAVARRNRRLQRDLALMARRARQAEEAQADRDVPGVDDPLGELLPVGVVWVGPDRRVLAANARATALLDIGGGQLVGRTMMEVLLDAQVEAALDAIPAGGAATVDARAGLRTQRLLVVRARRLASRELVLVLEDVSELHRLRQIRSEFIDNLSHELRTPLSTVSLLAETLAREAAMAEVPQKMRDRIARIEVETGHLVQMAAELLDLARIEGGSQLRLEDDVDLGLLAASSAERLRLFAERQGVVLSVDAAPGLPRIRGDADRLGQVLVNLVHNAVKFSPDGGEVRVIVRRDGDAAELLVVDHGIGIAAADRPRVFERFYKVDRARVRGGGTGLGLSIARHIVEGHGGTIGVESQEGQGSTFSVRLPLAAPAPVPAPSAT